jgi:hypothetical protein
MKYEMYIPWLIAFISIVLNFIFGIKNYRLKINHHKLQETVREESTKIDKTKHLMDCLDAIAKERTETTSAIKMLCNAYSENKNSQATKDALNLVETTQDALFNSLERLAFRLNNCFYDKHVVESLVLPNLPEYIENFIKIEITIREITRKPLFGKTTKSGEELKIFAVQNLPENIIDELDKKADEAKLYSWNISSYKRMYRNKNEKS